MNEVIAVCTASPITAYVLLALALLSFLWLYAFRLHDYVSLLRSQRSKQADDTPERQNEAQPLVRLSVVVVTHDSAAQLEQNIPLIMAQRHPNFEVIIVDMASTDDTPDALKRLQTTFPTLRHTFVPATARYIERRKLAVTLGIRAARAEWVVVVDADCTPCSDTWLESIAKESCDGVDLVLGYSNYDATDRGATRAAIYRRLRRQLANRRAAQMRRAVDAESVNVCYRKAAFLRNNGFADSLTLPFGEEAIYADAFSERGTTAFAFTPYAAVMQAVPKLHTTLHAMAVERIEVARHKRVFARYMRLREGSATLAAHVLLLAVAAFILLRTMQLSTLYEYPLSYLAADIPMLVCLLAALFVPCTLASKASKALGWDALGVTPIVAIFTAPYRGLALKTECRIRRRSFVRKF